MDWHHTIKFLSKFLVCLRRLVKVRVGRGYNGVGGVFCIFAQFSVGYACRGDRIKGGLLNIGTLTLPVVYTIYWCAVVPGLDCFTYKDTNYATRHLTFHCPKSLGRTYRGYKELFDEKDIRL